MKLDLQKIKDITVGAVNVREMDGEFVFDRFTEEQYRCYAEYRSEEFLKRALTSAGIRLSFETDSNSLSFKYSHTNDFTLGIAFVEVHVNGEHADFFALDLQQVGADACVTLPEGVNTVDLYLPWQKSVSLSDVTLDDGATLTPVKRSKTMISYGDSITHGISAQLPSNSYVALAAKMLDADAYNKAVSGDRFFPELLVHEEQIKPDIVTVAYGTNDWWTHSRETVARRSRDFLTRISEKYPDAKIFVISPIWRAKNFGAPKFDGPASDVHVVIKASCEGLKNVTLLNGWNFMPHDPSLYNDGLHPRDNAMKIYAQSLFDEIKKYI